MAVLITVGAGAWAWSLASAEFSPAPRLPSPGTVVVATQSASSATDDALQVSVTYGNDPTQPKASLMIAINQLPEKMPPSGPPAKLYVLLCGPIAQRPDFTDNRGNPITWATPKLDQGDVQSSSFGRASECIYTAFGLPPDGLRQMLLIGSAGAPISNLSGDRILYAVPGVVTMPARLPIGDINPGPLPTESTLTVHLDGVPGDIENVMASPQLPDTERLQWTTTLGPGNRPAREYRLAGDLHDQAISGQRNLFIAGALVGVAGGGLVWLLELTANLVIRLFRRPSKTTGRDPEPHTHHTNTSAEHASEE